MKSKKFQTGEKNQTKPKQREKKPLFPFQRFGKLTVIKFSYTKRENDRYIDYYECICDCGNKKITRRRNLLSKNVKSCGCLHLESVVKHGLRNTKLYSIWINIKQRCYNKNNTNYKYYGKIGIIMCEEWKNDVVVFYNWAIKNGYKENKKRNTLTIDRIDNKKGYFPENCRWVTMKIQSLNRKSNVNFFYKKETYCIKEWCKILNINYSTLRYRLKKGWSFKKSVETPVLKILNKKKGN